MIIQLRGTEPPAQQIEDQLRGLIASGKLVAHDKLPSVRQLAKDLGVATGTVAKAYKALETEGLLVSRTASGTRVSERAEVIPRNVQVAAFDFIDVSIQRKMTVEDATRLLRALWPEN